MYLLTINLLDTDNLTRSLYYILFFWTYIVLLATLQLHEGLLSVYCPPDLVRSIGTCFSVRYVDGLGNLETFGIITSDAQICTYLLLCVWNKASVLSF